MDIVMFSSLPHLGNPFICHYRYFFADGYIVLGTSNNLDITEKLGFVNRFLLLVLVKLAGYFGREGSVRLPLQLDESHRRESC